MTLNPAPERLAFPGLRISDAAGPPHAPAQGPIPAGNPVATEWFCPYRGLKPFDERDRPFFVGREDDARLIIANLYASPLTVLYGASGVGKTSVLQAGVLPLLREARQERPAVVLFRAWQTEDFAAALHEQVRRAVTAAGVDQAEPDGLPLDEYLEQCAARMDGPVLLVFDQFEEYFMYNPPGPASARFEAELARAVNRRLPKVRFLFCMREEGLSSLDRFRRRIPNVLGNLLRLEPLDREGARRAITEPLETYNELRETLNLQGMRIDPQLVEKLLSLEITFEQTRRGSPDAIRAPREQAVQLPFLQLVLTRLWSQERASGSRVLRAETLHRMGGANAVVHRHLNEALRRLKPRQRRVAARTFCYLVTPSLTKIAHTPSDLAKMTVYDRGEVEAVLRRLELSDLRILRRIEPVPGTDSEERYEITHDALAPAIRHWLEDRERRRREWRVGLFASGAVLALITVFLLWQTWNNRERAADRRVRSEVGLTIARLLLPSDPQASHDTAHQALALHWTAPGHDLTLRAAFDDRLLRVLPGVHGGRPLWSVAYNATGTRLLSAGEDHAVVVWSTRTNRPLRRIAGLHQDTIYRAVFSPDARFVATAGDDGTATLWDSGEPAARRLFKARGGAPVLSVAFARDGKSVVVGAGNGRVTIWPLATPLRSRSFRTRWGGVAGVGIDPSGARIAVASEHSIVSVWNAASMQREWSVENSGRYVHDAEFAPAGNQLATASRDGIGRVWDVATGRVVARLRGHTDWIYDIAWSPDGTLLATGSRDGTIRLWDAASGQLLSVLRGGGGGVRSVAFRPGGAEIATAHEDGNIRLWRVRAPVRILRAPLETLPARKLETDSSDARDDPEAHETELRRIRIPGRSDADSVRGTTVTPDARWQIATTDDGAWIWRPGEAAHRLPDAEKGIPVPFFTDDDRWVVVADPQGGVSVFSCEECPRIRALATGAPPPVAPSRPRVGATPE